MTASIYPPAKLTIYDPGNIPEFWVDGCAYYTEQNGIIRTGFYVLDAMLPGCDLKSMARLSFGFRCTMQTQKHMIDQVREGQRNAWPLTRLDLS